MGRKALERKLEADKKERIFEELSAQIARKDKTKERIEHAMCELEDKLKTMAIREKKPKPMIHELLPSERSKVFAIMSLLSELKFLSTEANSEYLLDCWLDIKSQYSVLSEDAKRVVLPKIRAAIRPLGKQFRI